MITVWFSVALALLELTFVARAILRPYRAPASRMTWVIVISAFPIAGIVLYVFFGETNVGRKRRKRTMRVRAKLLPHAIANQPFEDALATVPPSYRNAFRTAGSISGFPLVSGNRADLIADSDTTIDRIVADIDAAERHVHLLFYIWLSDRNGLRVIDALKRAAQRGVTCRAMVDHLGSLALVRSEHWASLQAAGVNVASSLPLGNPLLRPLQSRIDLRNHRKIVVIDGRVTYCGSQNCADPAFLPKRRFGPWVDAMVRFEGPIARQTQSLFVQDWMTCVDEDLSVLVDEVVSPAAPGIAAQAFGTGPTMRHAAMSEVFSALMHTARREIVVTTPYFVPDEAMMQALLGAAYRGVACTLIVPARNDSWIVAAASQSTYPVLVDAGVRVFEYGGGLLHAKTFTVDGCVTLIGSANLDRRSFELNYENNVLFHDETMTNEVRSLQERYLSTSHRITPQHIDSWPLGQRLWRNTIAMLSPLL